MIKIDIHSTQNLILLCPNHHEKAKRFEWKQLLDKPPEQWREIIADTCSKRDKKIDSTYEVK